MKQVTFGVMNPRGFPMVIELGMEDDASEAQCVEWATNWGETRAPILNTPLVEVEPGKWARQPVASPAGLKSMNYWYEQSRIDSTTNESDSPDVDFFGS